jgi:uncharacterized membrane protein
MSNDQPDLIPKPGEIKQESKPLPEIIEEKDPALLKAIPPKMRTKLAKITVSQTVIRCGPLPDPAELAMYNKIIPNGADRILQMTERQSAHRIEIEKLVINSQQQQEARGQYFALIIGLSGLVLGTYAGVCGFPWLGASLGGGTLVSLVIAFLKNKSDQSKELASKRPNAEHEIEDAGESDAASKMEEKL